MTLNATNILLRHNLIAIPASNGEAGQDAVATVLMNLSYYGRGLSVEGYKALVKLNAVELADWWVSIEPEESGRGLAKYGYIFGIRRFIGEILPKLWSKFWSGQ